MERYTVLFQPNNVSVTVDAGVTLLQAQIEAGLHPDAPCGGKGTCGKCKVTLGGQEILSCQTPVDRDMVVTIPRNQEANILTEGIKTQLIADGSHDYVIAFDIGTTTVVAYLLDGKTGALLANASSMNPQSQFGADVISRIQHSLDGGADEL